MKRSDLILLKQFKYADKGSVTRDLLETLLFTLDFDRRETYERILKEIQRMNDFQYGIIRKEVDKV